MSADATSMHELLERLAELESVSPEDRSGIAAVIDGRDEFVVAPELIEEGEEAVGTEPVSQPQVRPAIKADVDDQLYIRITKMLLPEKIRLALLGNATCRALLIRDSNRMIQAFVLKNPRLQAKEVEDFARNPNLSEFVIRNIADNQTWTKNYAAKLNLVLNPKTPLEISLKFMRYLNVYDVRRIAKSKNLPQTLTVMARKRMDDTQQGG